MSDEDAAKNTWTGRMAARLGFTEVSVRTETSDSAPGLNVYADFSKPGTRGARMPDTEFDQL